MGVVGWIFADTLLVLVVAFLATQTGGAVSKPAPTTTTATTTTTPTVPLGVDSGFVCFRVLADPALLAGLPSHQRDDHLKAVEEQVLARLAQPDLLGRQAGIVLSFGVADEPLTGEARATAFNSEVLPRLGVFSHRPDGAVVASRAFWGGNPKSGKPDGAITVNVYPMTSSSQGPIAIPPTEDC
ncbi:hypothetical protein [Umezawaea sp. Da 62-37]|uniref:hypothetical protein n=1 Tax=Umezawaea sp. Da 62-37 TaxID=3075927 RepID=UPI0028F72BB4|nr:hypothetical protein [Umezawaea sp. Da 62-37]WNV87630.1 hypothetical protein RM788_04820 [Umezawaea sp. Da 62-37]